MPRHPAAATRGPSQEHHRPPSKVKWDLEHPGFTIHPSPDQGDQIAAEAAAAGTTKAAVILAAWEAKEQAVAAAHAQGVVEGSASERKAANRELKSVRGQHATALAKAVEQAKAEWLSEQGSWRLAVEQRDEIIVRERNEIAQIRAYQQGYEAQAADAQKRRDELSRAWDDEREAAHELECQAVRLAAAEAIGTVQEELALQLQGARRELTEQVQAEAQKAASGQLTVLRLTVEWLKEQLEAARRAPILRLQDQMAADQQKWDAEREERKRKSDAEQADREAELEQRRTAEQTARSPGGRLFLTPTGLRLISVSEVKNG